MWGLLWRGGLPPLGYEVAPKPANAILQQERVGFFTTASQPNGAVRRSDKPPRHRGGVLPGGLEAQQMQALANGRFDTRFIQTTLGEHLRRLGVLDVDVRQA